MFSFENFVANERADIGQVMTNSEDIASGAMTYHPSLLRPYRATPAGKRGMPRVWVDVPVGNEERKDRDGNVILNSEGLPIYETKFEPQLVSDRHARDLPAPFVNNATVLPKDAWIRLDQRILSASRKRMTAWTDLRNANTLGGFNGMATPILEFERVTDVGEAVQDMDAMSEGRNIQPKYELQGMPLPITHSDFFLSERFLASSRNRSQPADTLRAEMAGRRIGETIEQQTIGTTTGITYGDSTDYAATSQVYGYVNHPDRITKTDVTASASFVPATFVNEVLAMRELAYAQNFYGPFMLYVSTAYDAKLDEDYVTGTSAQGLAAPTGTVRDRVRAIDGIQGVKRLDYLTGDVLVLVQMDSDTAEAVVGMDVTTVQWQTMGGMRLNFKVMAILAPRVRSKFINQGSGTTKAGIVHGTTS